MAPRQTNVKPEVLSCPLLSNQALVNIKHTSSTLLKPQAPAVFCGPVLKVGSDIKTYSPNDLSFGHITPPQRSIITTQDQVYLVPPGMSCQEACSYAAALLMAIATLKKELGIAFTSSHGRFERSSGEEQSGPRIVIVGGETFLGVALMQVLVRTRPDARIVALVNMVDQRELFQRVSQHVRLGAWYAIDGAIPDLTEYAGLGEKDGTELVISAVEREAVREDLRNSVDHFVKGNEQTVDELNLQDVAFTRAVHEMLAEAAEEFGKYQEPPDCCEFADEGEVDNE